METIAGMLNPTISVNCHFPGKNKAILVPNDLTYRVAYSETKNMSVL